MPFAPCAMCGSCRFLHRSRLGPVWPASTSPIVPGTASTSLIPRRTKSDLNAFRALRYVWLMSVLAPVPAWAGMARIYITNSAGDSIHVIDPSTNKVRSECLSRLALCVAHVGSCTGPGLGRYGPHLHHQ